MIRRDYIERLIEQAALALAQVARLVREGSFEPALLLLRSTGDQVLGPLARIVDRLDAASVARLAGRYELDRIRLYAALLAEEGSIHELRGHAARAARCNLRALELYAAVSMAGGQLKPADLERIRALEPAGAGLEGRYADELARLLAGTG